jgi:hypothetical protein
MRGRLSEKVGVAVVDLRKDLPITTNFISGYHVILLGKLIVHRMIGRIDTLLMVIYMDLNLERKFKR